MRILTQHGTLRQVILAFAALGPKPEEWPCPGSWAAQYVRLAPDPVVDLCGGRRGKTTWDQVPTRCAEWVVHTLQCQQVCRNTNWARGFGQCVSKCSGGPPSTDWCTKGDHDASGKTRKICDVFVGRWNECGMSTKALESEVDWYSGIDKCVFNCDDSLKIQADVSQVLSWRAPKCQMVFFRCGKEKNCLRVKDEDRATKCSMPLGYGNHTCTDNNIDCGCKDEDEKKDEGKGKGKK